ncbi:MAG: class II aldolase/adducin family protein [Desulfuromonadales bacterium]|nr:class II aldolase/adducin family protein [Desulfuromonadales bacterium]
MTQTNREGVIKFQLDFQEGPTPPEELLLELNAWREIFRRLGLLGQDPARYDGYGFGNLSRRLPGQDNSAFLISGTQTGPLQKLLPRHYATVEQCLPAANQLRASGQIQPSSEALSHASLYQSNSAILWVMHLHSPDIFNCRTRLKLPCTDPSAAHGTPAMAAEIQRLATLPQQAGASLLVMTGHQDGILAYGPSAAETGLLVVETLALALQQNSRSKQQSLNWPQIKSDQG